MLKRLIALFALGGLLFALLAYSQTGEGPLQVSGFIEADEIRLGSRVGGRVARVHVDEGAEVVAGATLVELEPYDLRERLAQATAERTAREAELEKLSGGYRDEEIAEAKARFDQLTAHAEKLEHGPRPQEIAAAQARLRQASSQLELAQMKFARTKKLFDNNTATRDEMDVATTELTLAQEHTRVRDEELKLLLAGTREEEKQQAQAQKEEAYQGWLLRKNGYREEDKAQARAALEAASAMVRAIETQLEELTIRAPVAGSVEAVELQPGDLVGPNAPVISLVDSAHLWVRAYVPENRLNLQVGQKVAVSVDSFPDESFVGHVSYVARQAEFTPGNVQTPEERSKQVFRIKVQLTDTSGRLRPGMAADLLLETASR